MILLTLAFLNKNVKAPETSTTISGVFVFPVNSPSREFRYKDKTGALVATAKAEFSPFQVIIDVFDARGQKIGTIREQIFSSLFGVVNKYIIFDASNNKIAETDKFQFVATKFTITDNKRQLVATISRPAFQLMTDKWTVSVHNSDVVDSRILVVIAAFKTAEDNSDD